MIVFHSSTQGTPLGMSDRHSSDERLTAEELEEANGETLPDREEMAVVPDALSGGITLPVQPPDEF